jgi:hypothetical protein
LVLGGLLGLLGLCAGLRAGQCARLLEDNPDLAVPAPAQELRRAA